MKHSLVLVALFACKDKPPAAAPVPAAPAAPPAAADAPEPAAVATPGEPCDARAERLRMRLEALVKTKPGYLPTVLPAGLALPAARAGKPIDEPGVVVVVTRDGQVIASGNTVPLAEGPRLIDEAFWRTGTEAMHMDRGPKRPWVLYVWADREVKASALATLFADAELMKAFKTRLLVEGDPAAGAPDLLAKPQVAKLHAAVTSAGSLDAAMTTVAKGMRDAGDPCRSLPMAYAESSIESGPVNQLAVMAERIPQALVDCACANSDPDVFEYGMLSIFGAFQPTPKWIALPKLATTDKRTVADLAN